MALCGGVHPDSKLARKLTKEKPLTLQDFFHVAGKYMRLEDAASHRLIEKNEGTFNNRRTDNLPAKKEVSRPPVVEKDSRQQNTGTRRDGKRQFMPGPRFDSYTP